MQVKKILLPNKPQLDPIAAVYLLGAYGEDKYPGVSAAGFVYWEKGEDPTAEEISQFEKDGVLMIDVGGGIFDHHSRMNGSRETVTTLVARALNIENNPELSALFGYVRADELEGLHNRYGDLVHLIKSMYKQGRESNQVVETTLKILHLIQNGQREWHIDVKRELGEKCKEVRVKRFKRKLKVCVIESDSLQVGNYAITVKNYSVVIQKRSTGHVMIQTNQHHNIDLREIIAAIRKRELEMNVYQKPIDVKRLKFEGKSMLVPNWFYHRSLNAFLNGSDALAQTEATKVPFADIIKFVLYGLTTEESELCDCAEGGSICPYRAYGFAKCEAKRNQANQFIE
jgi:hypothetical protein